MKKVILILLSIICISTSVYAQSIEDQIHKFASHEYPNNLQMQQYVYNQQFSAYKYMSTVKDIDVKQIALREYPNDYSMQQYVYNQQFSAKQYMNAQNNSIAKSQAQREYPNNYSMQQYIFNQIQFGNF